MKPFIPCCQDPHTLRNGPSPFFKIVALGFYDGPTSGVLQCQTCQAVFKFAVRKQADVCERILKRNGLKGSDIDAFIPHQANRRIITATADRLGLKPESVIINIDRYGNTTAGTIPLAMETARQEGKLKKGNLVLLASVGAGFTVGATLLRWAY